MMRQPRGDEKDAEYSSDDDEEMLHPLNRPMYDSDENNEEEKKGVGVYFCIRCVFFVCVLGGRCRICQARKIIRLAALVHHRTGIINRNKNIHKRVVSRIAAVGVPQYLHFCPKTFF